MATAAPLQPQVSLQTPNKAVGVPTLPPFSRSEIEIPTPTLAALVDPGEPSLIQLAAPLDEPEFYCVDVPGFRNSLRTDRPLQAHTCKPGADDELFTFNHIEGNHTEGSSPRAGQLYMEAYKLCVEGEDGLAYTRACSDVPSQRFKQEADGTLRTGDGELCLAAADGKGEGAGGPSHLRRDLRLLPCAQVEPELSQWLFPGIRLRRSG